MNNIITTNPNGQPFVSQDVALIQSNIKELTTALSKQLIGSSSIVRLYGAEVSVTGSGGATPTLSITSGALWYLDEIYLVDAVVSQAIAGGTTSETVKANWSWDLSSLDYNPRDFKYGGSNNTFNNRKAVYVITPTTWTGLNYNSTPTVQSLITASESDLSAGSELTKFVTPSTLGRQGSSFSVTYPITVTDTNYYSPTIYKNGYFQTMNVSGIFTVGGTSQEYIDIVFGTPVISYGYTNQLFTIPCVESKTGYHTSNINLVGELIDVYTLRLRKTYNGSSLIINSSPTINPTFSAGVTYKFTFRSTN